VKYLALLAFLTLASSAFAAQASVSGKVADQDGAVFVNLPVVIRNMATHQKSEVKTTKAGMFGPVSLPAGVYRVEIRTNCVKRYSKEVTLSGTDHLQLDISLVTSCPQPAIVE
jgi:hypothetical protein